MDYSLPPYSVTHVIYERHVKHGYAMYDVHICEAHVCVCWLTGWETLVQAVVSTA